MLASGTQVYGFEPDRSHRIFQGEKILSMPSFGGEVKPSVPCCRFAACKRFLQIAWNSLFDAKLTGHFSLIVSPFVAGGLTRRRRGGFWRYKRELPKPGSYNKPACCSNFGGTSHRGLVEEEDFVGYIPRSIIVRRTLF
jgi:hypothetical protein